MTEGEKNPETLNALDNLSRFSLSTFAVTVLRFGIRLLKTVVFTRLLGPAGRGVFGLLTTVPDLIVSLGNMGFGLGNTYLIAKRKYDLQKIIGNTVLFTLLLGLCLTGIGYIVFCYEGILKGDSVIFKDFILLVLMLIPFVLLERFGTDLLIATKQIHSMNILRLVFSGLPVVLIVAFWLFTGEALKSAMYAWAMTFIIVSLWSLKKVIPEKGLPVKMSFPYFKEGLSFGIRGHLSIFANALVRRIDYLFISSMLGAEALGYYCVCVSMVEIFLAVPDAIYKPFLPIHLELDPKDAETFTPIVIRHVFFIMILICLCAAIGGKLFIWILFGEDFLLSYGPMLWLLPGILFLSIYSLLRADMYSRNLPGLVSWVSVITLVCNIILNFLLIPTYGINGAAISSSLSYGLSTSILLIKFIRLTHNSWQDVLLIKTPDIILLWNTLKTKYLYSW